MNKNVNSNLINEFNKKYLRSNSNDIFRDSIVKPKKIINKNKRNKSNNIRKINKINKKTISNVNSSINLDFEVIDNIELDYFLRSKNMIGSDNENDSISNSDITEHYRNKDDQYNIKNRIKLNLIDLQDKNNSFYSDLLYSCNNCNKKIFTPKHLLNSLESSGNKGLEAIKSIYEVIIEIISKDMNIIDENEIKDRNKNSNINYTETNSSLLLDCYYLLSNTNAIYDNLLTKAYKGNITINKSKVNYIQNIIFYLNKKHNNVNRKNKNSSIDDYEIIDYNDIECKFCSKNGLKLKVGLAFSFDITLENSDIIEKKTLSFLLFYNAKIVSKKKFKSILNNVHITEDSYDISNKVNIFNLELATLRRNVENNIVSLYQLDRIHKDLKNNQVNSSIKINSLVDLRERINNLK